MLIISLLSDLDGPFSNGPFYFPKPKKLRILGKKHFFNKESYHYMLFGKKVWGKKRKRDLKPNIKIISMGRA